MSDVLTLLRSAIATMLVVLGVVLGPVALAAEGQTTLPSKSGIDAILGAAKASGQEDFLPPDQAFQLVASADGPDKVRLEWVVHEGYYLYKSRIKVTSASSSAQLGAPVLPDGETKTDEYFGTQEVYHRPFSATSSSGSLGWRRDVAPAAT